VSAISALLFGRWFDRRGAVGLIVAALVAALFAPFVFAGNLIAATAGVVLWGVGMGIQDSLMSAPVSIMIPAERRANALGIFNAIYGSSWFVGSSLLGFLYGLSVPALVAFSIAAEIAAVLVLIIMRGPLDAYRRPQTQTSS
jgi:MFS family permease